MQPIASLTVQIYTYAISPFPDWQGQAWAGAPVLTVIVLALETRGKMGDGRASRGAALIHG